VVSSTVVKLIFNFQPWQRTHSTNEPT